MVNILGRICKNILVNKLCILVNFQLESLKSFKSICLKRVLTYLFGRMLIGLIRDRDLTFWVEAPNLTANQDAALWDITLSILQSIQP